MLLGLGCCGALADLASAAGYVNEIVDALRVQSDWNQTDSGALDYIKNKPEIPSVDVVNNLAQVVGNDTTGLVKSVADLQTDVSEINNSLGQKENVVNKTQTIDGNSTAEQYPSAVRFRQNLHCPLIWMVGPAAVVQPGPAIPVMSEFINLDKTKNIPIFWGFLL